MEVMLLLLSLLFALLCVGCEESRFIISPDDHSLSIITNLGAIRSVDELLEHEPFVLRGYGLEFELESDRTAVFTILQRHAAGENYLEAAAEYLPLSWDTCEPFTDEWHEVENMDGSLEYQATCHHCGTVFDVTELVVASLPPDESSVEPNAETSSWFSEYEDDWFDAMENAHAEELDLANIDWGDE